MKSLNGYELLEIHLATPTTLPTDLSSKDRDCSLLKENQFSGIWVEIPQAHVECLVFVFGKN